MQNRAETLKSINVRGALNNEAKVEMEKKLEEVDAEIEIKKAAQQLAQSNVNAALYVQQHYQPAVNPEIKTQKEKLAALLQKRNTPDASAGERIAELEAKQKEAEADMANAQAKLNEIEQNRKHQTNPGIAGKGKRIIRHVHGTATAAISVRPVQQGTYRLYQ